MHGGNIRVLHLSRALQFSKHFHTHDLVFSLEIGYYYSILCTRKKRLRETKGLDRDNTWAKLGAEHS